MAFARATGEYGSVIFIAGNVPFKSEILPLIIVSKFELFDLPAAAAVALFMLIISFAILLTLNLWQWRLSSRTQGRY
ncbi:MAG: molybdate ABC transporter permease subunit, partial [Snodgrassella alvi]|nr:molybdate ABC transporter permease subunit [Snodgrassella alvi]